MERKVCYQVEISPKSCLEVHNWRVIAQILPISWHFSHISVSVQWKKRMVIFFINMIRSRCFMKANQTVLLGELLSEQHVTVGSGTHPMSLHITRAIGETNYVFQSGQKSTSPETKLHKINSMFILDNCCHRKETSNSTRTWQ